MAGEHRLPQLGNGCGETLAAWDKSGNGLAAPTVSVRDYVATNIATSIMPLALKLMGPGGFRYGTDGLRLQLIQ